MACDRRISATFKDLPGGQVLGPTTDYTHRLLDFKLAAAWAVKWLKLRAAALVKGDVPHVAEFLNLEELIEQALWDNTPPHDLTREPLGNARQSCCHNPLGPDPRGRRLYTWPCLFNTACATGCNHAFVGELRIGSVPIEMDIPELGFAVEIGEVTLTECETVNQFTGSKTEPPQFTRGYGLGLWSDRTQSNFDGTGRSRVTLGRTGRGQRRGSSTGRGIRAVPPLIISKATELS